MSLVRSLLKPRVKAVKKPAASKKNAKQSVSEDVLKKIELKAYELYEKRGKLSGFETEDWLEAERLVKAEMEKNA